MANAEVGDDVYGDEARARAFSFWGAVVGIGIASGPVVGGLILRALAGRGPSMSIFQSASRSLP
jgi:MFS family permease